MKLHDCSQPWFELQINYNGSSGCCCYYKGQTQRLNFNQPLDLDSLWNGPGMQSIRRIIGSGQEEGTGCEGCQWLRYASLPQFIEDVPDELLLPNGAASPVAQNWRRAQENYQSRAIEVDSYPVKYYFNFGMACNIRCIMCSQTHTREEDRSILPVEPLLHLKPYLILADQIHIIGGEPLIIPTAREFIQQMFGDPAFSQTMLALYTNGTLLHQYLDKFRALSRINICVSLDSIGQGYEHIRSGAHWEQTERNILDFKELGVRLGLQWQATVACIIMKSSIATLDSFVKWCVTHDIPCHFAPISFIDIAIDEDVFRFPALLDQIPDWEHIFDRAIEMLQKKGWDIARAESLQTMKQELQTACKVQRANERIRQMVSVAMSHGVAVEEGFKAYITKAQGLAELGYFERLSAYCEQVEQQLDSPTVHSSACTPGEAFWKQRHILASNLDRLGKLRTAVGHRTDLSAYQWAQLFAMSLEFKPDLIIELGRGKGNSTCLFTEVAGLLGGKSACRIVSICLSSNFMSETLPRLLYDNLIDRRWLEPLECWQADICAFNYEQVLKDKKRVLVFWDAHGYQVAGCVLGKLLPLIENRQHLVIMHDMSDQRYMSEETKSYREQRLWRGNNWDGPRILLGNINSSVEQAVSIVDFISRNAIELTSADHSLYMELGIEPEKVNEMSRLLGNDYYSLRGDWFCFSLNNFPGPFTFPRFVPSDETEGAKPIELVQQLLEQSQ